MERNTLLIGNERGIALFFVLMFFLTAAFGLTSLGRLGGSMARNVQHNLKSSNALYLSESAAEEAKLALSNNFFTGLGDSATSVFGEGEYFFNIDASPDADATKRVITAYGAIPDFDDPKSNRTVQALVQSTSDFPGGFWDKAIYSAGEIRANGNSYDVTGDCVTAGVHTSSDDPFNNAEDTDPSIAPLFALSFQAIKALAQSQTYNGHDNYYTADEIGTVAFPQEFYYEDPDPADPESHGTPHVVFIEGNLTLNGNWGTMGGFIIVVGDVLTDPLDSGDATINGNGTIDGVLYTNGAFGVNGGGGGINVSGGVFAADGVTMNGNTTVTYNQEYMDALEAMDFPTGIQVLSWNEIASDL